MYLLSKTRIVLFNYFEVPAKYSAQNPLRIPKSVPGSYSSQINRVSRKYINLFIDIYRYHIIDNVRAKFVLT